MPNSMRELWCCRFFSLGSFLYLRYLVLGNLLNHLELAIYTALCRVLWWSDKIEWQIIAAFW